MRTHKKVILITVWIMGVSASALAQVNFPGGRIAVSTDGNQHDQDDWAATPVTALMLDIACLNDRLVHYDFANHLGDNNSSYEAEMVTSAIGAAQRFDLDPSVFFNDQTNLEAAVAHLRDAINASSASDHLYLICGGPMEVPWRGINASDVTKRQFLTVISHSNWNNTHQDTNQMNHDWDDIKSLPGGLNAIKIADQNGTFNSPYPDWHWTRDSSDPDLNWLWGRINSTGKTTADVSDAGMMWYVLTGLGDQDGRPQDVRALYEAGCAAGGLTTVTNLHRTDVQ